MEVLAVGGLYYICQCCCLLLISGQLYTLTVTHSNAINAKSYRLY